MNELLLKWQMKKHGDTNETLAEALEIHPHTLYMKMKGKRQQFTLSEIRTIVKRYSLKSEETNQIFFE